MRTTIDRVLPVARPAPRRAWGRLRLPGLALAAFVVGALGCGGDRGTPAPAAPFTAPRADGSGDGPSTALSAELAALLDECEADIGPVEGLEPAAPVADGPLPCEFRARDPELGFEVRASFRPLSRVQVEYDDPHSAAPEPDHLYPMLFPALLQAVSAPGEVGEDLELGAEQAAEWGADWAAMSLTTPDPDYGGGRTDLLFVGLHRNGVADVFLAFLFDADHPRAKEWVGRQLHLVRFRAEEAAPDREGPP